MSNNFSVEYCEEPGYYKISSTDVEGYNQEVNRKLKLVRLFTFVTLFTLAGALATMFFRKYFPDEQQARYTFGSFIVIFSFLCLGWFDERCYSLNKVLKGKPEFAYFSPKNEVFEREMRWFLQADDTGRRIADAKTFLNAHGANDFVDWLKNYNRLHPANKVIAAYHRNGVLFG